MISPRSLPLAALAACFLLLLSLPVRADMYWESEQVTENMPGQQNSTQLVKNYLSEDASRTEAGGKVSIITYDDMTMYQLNPEEKTYVKVDMKKLGMPPDAENMDPQKLAQAQAMIKEMFGKMKVVPTDETKTIAGYLCKRYNVELMMMQSEYWTSKDVKGYGEIATVSKKMQKAFQDNPVLKNMDVLGMMDSLDGFPVQIVSKMMGGTSTTTLKKIETKRLSKDLFEVPKDYKQVERKAASRPAAPPPPVGLPRTPPPAPPGT